jgi:alkanesulfonate monooxygenase
MSAYPSEGPVPELKPSKMFNNPEHLARQARAENMNLRQFALHVANTKAHNIVIGTPTEVCDVLEKWFKEEACDGFSLMPGMVPGGLDDFVDLVTPELQRRGLFRREYEGKTLRENLGLARPADARRRLVGQAKEQGALHA